MSAIVTENLTRRFGSFTAVDRVNFTVERGEVFGFLGPNGSGKTTVIKMLTGILPLTSGRGVVDGIDVTADPDGVKQRLALSCAMMHGPKILYLDEPTAGIDPVARRKLWDLLFELSGQGITFFVTTHYMDEAERCSHLAYIYYGKLIADGTPETLRSLPEVNPPGTHRFEISAPAITTALRKAKQMTLFKSATIFGRSIHALVDESVSEHELDHELRGHGMN